MPPKLPPKGEIGQHVDHKTVSICYGTIERIEALETKSGPQWWYTINYDYPDLAKYIPNLWPEDSLLFREDKTPERTT